MMRRIFLSVALCFICSISYAQRPRPPVRDVLPTPISASSLDSFDDITATSRFYNRPVNQLSETVDTLSNLEKINLLGYDTSGIALGRLGATNICKNTGALISPRHVLVAKHVSTPITTQYVFRNKQGEIVVCGVDQTTPRVVIKDCNGHDSDMAIVRLSEPAVGCTPLKVVDIQLFPSSFGQSSYMKDKEAIFINGDGRLIRLYFASDRFWPCVVRSPSTPLSDNRLYYKYGASQQRANHSGSPILLASNGELFVFGAVKFIFYSSGSSVFHGLGGPPTNYYISQISNAVSSDKERIKVVKIVQ